MEPERHYTVGLLSLAPPTVVEETSINPFTREPMTIRAEVLPPWPAARREAVNRLLEGRGGHPDPIVDGFTLVPFPGGSEIRLCFGHECDDADSELDIVCPELTREIAEFVLEVLRAADMGLVSRLDEEERIAIASPRDAPWPTGRWEAAEVVETPGQLIGWLDRSGDREAG